MMQASESWHGYDPATRIVLDLGSTTRRSSLLQCKMRSVVVVIADVFAHKAFQMPFVEHDYVVEQIPAAVANPELSDAVLPRTAEAGLLRLYAEALHNINDIFVEVRAAIKDQIPRRRIVRNVSRNC
jgi:hypothetical protein